eukprot:CAMPEP_0202728576 /NCGR_PEP_ID=MMETSP1385-20130828/185696_1 /ASSEMBLY_ACC=CAM_ASM_000861 /TAXON_ID=933848 /ORGANISM="Elphidium margaritaceum" /LENGTH=829 /DNA_ID=CAMNT_0049394827 /DNA_START=40 /DNA_END=2525 /DNA_ORIENTATION=+
MGAGESTEKLGQRVLIAKSKLESDLKTATDRYEYLKQHSPRTLKTMIESVSASFETCAPFLESTLLIAWLYDAAQCESIVLSACKKVLRAPINDVQYNWFKQYVFSSNIWMMKTKKSGKFLYEELLAIGNDMSSDIVANMDSIFEHLQSHKQWQKVLAIKNETLVARQDDKKVGLLNDAGLSNVFEAKSDDQKSEDMKTFVDSNMAINILTSTAAKINEEFQKHVKLVMSSHGSYKTAPMKKVERSLSKVENDYAGEQYPKSAKLLDLVRCSVTFNTVEQLIKGYDAFLRHIKATPSIIELARVKNGFLDANITSGYRDIKINVIYKSQDPDHKNVKMVCEVQFLLINYLEEKKKIHKLYSILREETFFKMVVSENVKKTATKNVTDLKFKEALTVSKGLISCKDREMFKCSVDNDLGLLGMESNDWFGVVEMKSKQEVWSLKRSTSSRGVSRYGFQTHQWLNIGQQKYVSVQTGRNKIQMFNVKQADAGYQFVEDKKYELVYSEQQRRYLEEKKKIHKLYSILREETFFKMVVSQQTEKRPAKDIKDLQFKETLNVAKDVTLSYASKNKEQIHKCSVDTELGLLGMEGHDWFGVVDMASKQEVWKLDRKTNNDAMGGASGYQTHEWFFIGKQKYLSLQTDRNKIKMFKVDNKSQFVEDSKYELTYSSSKGDNATINFCDFDANFEHIFLVVDNQVLQKRAVSNINKVLQSIELKESVKGSLFRNFRLSADGKFCVLGGGYDKKHFFVVDIENEKQIHLTSKKLNSTYVPCFINGENKLIAVSDKNGTIEIWDVEKQETVKTLQVDANSTGSKWIKASASRHNILAIGS